jgi:TatD DNase family protein
LVYVKKKQQVSFTEHIQASQSMHLPIIVHNRSSDDDCAQILNSEQQNSPFTGLIHCFASDVAFARKVLDIGFYISIAGIITFNNAQNLVEVVKYTPLDRLLIETDSPYLAPIPMRGKANEPAFVAFVAAKIAEIKNIALSQVIQTTGDNFFNLFSKATR